jgi:hypothetical protein
LNIEQSFFGYRINFNFTLEVYPRENGNPISRPEWEMDLYFREGDSDHRRTAGWQNRRFCAVEPFLSAARLHSLAMLINSPGRTFLIPHNPVINHRPVQHRKHGG